MKVCEKIRCYRQLKGWTQEEVAEKLDMSPNGYGSIERGDTDVTLSRLEKIAEVFGVELLELLNSKEVFVLNMGEIHGGTNHSQNWYNHSPVEQLQKFQNIIEKQQCLIEQQTKEIAYLQEIINLLKEKQV